MRQRFKMDGFLAVLKEFVSDSKAFFIAAIAGGLAYMSSYYTCRRSPECEEIFMKGMLFTKVVAGGFIGYLFSKMLDPSTVYYEFIVATSGAGAFSLLEAMGKVNLTKVQKAIENLFTGDK